MIRCQKRQLKQVNSAVMQQVQESDVWLISMLLLFLKLKKVFGVICILN